MFKRDYVLTCVRAFDADIMAALEHVQSLTGIHIIAAVNLSLGGGRYEQSCDNSSLKPVMDSLELAGVATVVVVAAIYAQEVMNFDSQQLIILIMVVNLTAAIGAFLFGSAQDRFGSVPTLAGALGVWIMAIGIAFFADGLG